jgi:hypothetical protein
MVRIQQEVTLLTVGAFLEIVIGFVEPILAGRSEVLPQHPRDISVMRHPENRCLRSL